MNFRFIKNTVLSCVVLLQLANASAHANNKAQIQIGGSSAQNIEDYIVQIPVEDLKLNIGSYIIKENGTIQSPVEIITDIWGKQHALFIVPKLKSKQIHNYNLEMGKYDLYPKRTSAELSHKIGGQFIGKEYIGGFSWVKTNSITLPGTFTDHSYYIKYEGPGWESDRTAYRMYLDNRNAFDVFGKVVPSLVLAGVGVDNFDNYHKLAAWGMDNLKVSKSLGLGSIAHWDGTKAVRVDKKDSTTCIIAADGKLRSQVKTIYHGWQAGKQKVNLTSLISIDAGSYASHIELKTNDKIDNIATGIIKHNSAKLIVPQKSDEEWTYIATFGKQSLNKDMQGLAIFVRAKQVKQITEDEFSHVVVLQPNADNYVEYYMMNTWELDPDAVKTKEDFINSIDKQLNRLNNKIEYQIKSK